jgi:hypothetical protein
VRLREDWPARLSDVVQTARARPFKWGDHDCCLFACDAILAMTGVDMAEGLRGSYDDLPSAVAAMKRLCGGGLERLAEHIAAQYGREVAPAFAPRGAVTLFDDPAQGPALGVCLGARTANLGRNGLVMVPMRLVRRAWMV